MVRVAAIQFACTDDVTTNIATADRLVREAAAKGAKIILLQELFMSLYFCQEQDPKYNALASEYNPANPHLQHFIALAMELHVVLPISFYEVANNVYFNSLTVINADGELLGLYRKSHIPDGPGYQEKFYFSPGDTGFKVFRTTFGVIGVAICWDQWFPEAARCMVLQGAEMLFYPTAIGSEPKNSGLDSSAHWERTMVGHSAANMVPVIACNRIGTESFVDSHITFYGSSFITDGTGNLLAHADRSTEQVITADVDIEQCRADRIGWGIFRDRRTDLYRPLLTKDGSSH